MSYSTFAVAKAKARAIIAEWSIMNPAEIDLEIIASQMNLLIIERSITGAVARIVCKGSAGFISVSDRIIESGRKRFAIAHEIGHYVLHRSAKPLTICTDDDFQDWYEQSPAETEANVFAAELLMPEDLFRPRCADKTPSFAEVQRLAHEFQTSLSAAAIRYVNIGNKACVLVASKNGKIEWVSANSAFPYRVNGRGVNLDKYSCANDFFQSGKTPSSRESVIGTAWLTDYGIGENCFLYEEVIPLKSYNTVLSLIWIDEDNN
ncbi:ImmA/IrrE family metallo-endopeptidase [bacterium]|nr:MAG: ImmA/IrrE family metallo-endopeptidase [bacterium]